MTAFLERESANDLDLISSARNGDEEAVAELYLRHHDAAARYARGLTDPTTAEDLVAEAFAKLLESIRTGGGPSVAFRPYLLRTVHNVYVNHVRTDSRHAWVEDADDLDVAVPDAADQRRESAVLASAFAALPERWQAVLWHTAVEGEDHETVGRMLGLKANAVAALAFRSRDGLRRAYLDAHLGTMRDEACRPHREQLASYVRGRVRGGRRQRLEQHLSQCADCTAGYLELSAIGTNLGALLAPAVLGTSAAAYAVGTSAGAGGIGGLGGLLGFLRGGGSGSSATTAAAAVAAAVVVAAAAVGLAVAIGEDAPEPVAIGDPPAPSVPAPAPTTSAAAPPPATPDPPRTPEANVALPTTAVPAPRVVDPTGPPAASPTTSPPAPPSVSPSASPSASPSVSPSAAPTASPTVVPSASPSGSPTDPATPTTSPSEEPTDPPTEDPLTHEDLAIGSASWFYSAPHYHVQMTVTAVLDPTVVTLQVRDLVEIKSIHTGSTYLSTVCTQAAPVDDVTELTCLISPPDPETNPTATLFAIDLVVSDGLDVVARISAADNEDPNPDNNELVFPN